MTPEERIAQLEAQMAEVLQRLNTAPSTASAGSHLAVDRATFNEITLSARLEVNGDLRITAPRHINVILDRTDSQDHMTLTVGSQGTGIHFGAGNLFFISADPYVERDTRGIGNELLRLDANGNLFIRGTV